MEKQAIRVAVLTAQQRDVRVIGIVLTHLKSAKHVFTLVNDAMAADIALVDDTDPGMRERLADARAANPGLAAVHIVRELGQAGPRIELQSSQLMMQLLTTLEQLVARRAAAPATAAPAEPAAAKSVASGKPKAAGVPAKLRALVVDDSQTVRTQLASVMSKIGMVCDIADGAKAALSQLQQQQYDLIYVDVMMPDMDGYTLTREIKRDRSNKAPVIILTSQSSPFDRARGALAGCDIFLTKPVGLKQFYAATTKALRKSLAVDDLSGWITDPTQAVAPAPARAHA